MSRSEGRDVQRKEAKKAYITIIRIRYKCVRKILTNPSIVLEFSLKYCPVRDIYMLRSDRTSVHFNGYTINQLWFVYFNNSDHTGSPWEWDNIFQTPCALKLLIEMMGM